MFREIDLLILDGGEFSARGEFRKVEPRLRGFLILDDTKTRKCKDLLNELKSRSDYMVVWESEERNGAAVLRVVRELPLIDSSMREVQEKDS